MNFKYHIRAIGYVFKDKMCANLLLSSFKIDVGLHVLFLFDKLYIYIIYSVYCSMVHLHCDRFVIVAAIGLLIICDQGMFTESKRHKKRHRHSLRHGRNHTTAPSETNPLREQPNLSFPLPSKNSMISGSRNAQIITTNVYLRKEWCKTEPFEQVVREPGCLKKRIVNRFCYGQCNSFFIPKVDQKDKHSPMFFSCGFCKPKRSRWIQVTLSCPSRPIRAIRKRVLRIKECDCKAQNIQLP